MDGTLDWEVPRGHWHLFVFFQQPVETRVIGGGGAGPQLVLDHMNRSALEAHLTRISKAAGPEIGSFYGKTLRAGFCDSLEVEAEIYWTDDFLAEFQKRRGYDLIPWLPFIEIPGRGDIQYPPYQSAPWFDSPDAGRARQGYWQTVSDLWIDNFFAPFVDWLHARGLKARVQAHGAAVDLLKAYALADSIAAQRSRVAQIFSFSGPNLAGLKMNAISDTNSATQESVVPPRAARDQWTDFPLSG